MAKEQLEITKPFQVICEGNSDESFLRELTRRRGLQALEVRCARVNNSDRCSGISGFTDTLNGLIAVSQLSVVKLSRILLVRDSDDDPAVAFREAQECLKKASLPVPHAPRIVAKEKSAFGIETCIMTIPWDSPGCIETVLCGSARVSLPELLSSVDEFCDSTSSQTANWSITKKCKMRLRCFIAAHWEADPSLSLAWLLGKDKQRIADFNSPLFDDIFHFLETFCQQGGE